MSRSLTPPAFAARALTVEWRERRFLVTIKGRRPRRLTLSVDEAEDLIEQLCEQLGCHPGSPAFPGPGDSAEDVL